MKTEDQKPWTEAEFQQLFLFVNNIHKTINSMPKGTRLLLESHGFGRGRLYGFKRSTWKLRDALKRVIQ